MKEKILLLTLIITLTLSHTHAQNITGIHTLRIDDKVEKQLVEYEQNDESAMNAVWDLRRDHGVGSSDYLTFYIDYQNTNDPVLFWFDLNLGRGELENSNMKVREKSSEDLFHIHRSPIDTGDFWKTIRENMEK